MPYTLIYKQIEMKIIIVVTFFLDYWFSPYEFLLWFWLEALIPSQLNYLTDNLRSIYHKLGENGTGWSVYLKVFVGWRFQR